MEDAVCSDPNNASYVQENHHDEIAGSDCNIFDEEEEENDEKNNTLVADKPVRELTLRKKLVVKLHQKRKVVPSPTQVVSQLSSSLNQLVE